MRTQVPSVGQLCHAQPDYGSEQLHEQLVVIFRQGQVFASRIHRTPNGFMPDTAANWTTVPQTGYYGYDLWLGCLFH